MTAYSAIFVSKISFHVNQFYMTQLNLDSGKEDSTPKKTTPGPVTVTKQDTIGEIESGSGCRGWNGIEWNDVLEFRHDDGPNYSDRQLSCYQEVTSSKTPPQQLTSWWHPWAIFLGCRRYWTGCLIQLRCLSTTLNIVAKRCTIGYGVRSQIGLWVRHFDRYRFVP